MARKLAAILRDLESTWADWLFDLVAPKLAKRPVLLEWRKPYVKDFWGVCFADGQRSVIHIDPDLSDDDKLRVYCHELAHARLHHHKLESGERHKLAPRSHRLVNKPKYKREVAPIERDAEMLAETWLAYAERKAPGGSLRQKLQALQELS